VDWREGFPQLPLDKKNKFKEESWKAWGKEFLEGLFLVLFFLEKGGEAWWILVNDGKRESGLDVCSTSKK
jgi:hypothetical protein